MNSDRAARVKQLLQENLDWDLLLEEATRHRVMPLLCWHLNTIAPKAVPEPILTRIQAYFHRISRQNLLLTVELCRVLSLFEAHEITAIPFKGPVLAASVYGNLALRQSGDLDILVCKQDIDKAKDLLLRNDFRSYHELNSTREKSFIKQGWEYMFVNGNGNIVDLMWSLNPWFFSFPLDTEYLQNRSKPVSFAGMTILSLSPEDLLLILCVHGAKHWWERLFWICDIAELLRVYQDMDWEDVQTAANKLGSWNRVYLGLCLAHDLLGAELPTTIWQRIQVEKKIKKLAAQVKRKWLYQKSDDPSFSVKVSRRLFHLKTMERKSDKMKYCLALPPQLLKHLKRRRSLLNENLL